MTATTTSATVVKLVLKLGFIGMALVYLIGAVMTYLRFQNVKQTFSFKENKSTDLFVTANLVISVVVFVLILLLSIIA